MEGKGYGVEEGISWNEFRLSPWASSTSVGVEDKVGIKVNPMGRRFQ